jgi:hypothetical protein
LTKLVILNAVNENSGAVTLLWLVAGLIAVVVIIANQGRARPVRLRPSTVGVVLRWILLAYGVFLVVLVLRSQAKSHPLDLASIGLLVGMSVLAVGFGIFRGFATKLWMDERGHWYRRGGAPVVGLWIVSLGLHVGIDWILDNQSGIGGLGAVTTLAYLVVTLTAQNMTVRRRAARLLGPQPQ